MPGESRRLSTLELILKIVRGESFRGNPRAIRAMADFTARYGEQQAPEGAEFLVVGERLTEEEWEAEAAKFEKQQAKIGRNAG